MVHPVAVFRGTPKLDHDQQMREEFGHGPLRADQKVERRIVYALCLHLAEHGFKVRSVYDGEVTERIDQTLAPRAAAKAAMEFVFNLDEASLRFKKGDFHSHGVLLVIGNGCDMVSDWNYTDGDPDGFNAAMDAFDAEKFV